MRTLKQNRLNRNIQTPSSIGCPVSTTAHSGTPRDRALSGTSFPRNAQKYSQIGRKNFPHCAEDVDHGNYSNHQNSAVFGLSNNQC
jgi:hypothetical protein